MQFASQTLPGQAEPIATAPPEASVLALEGWRLMGGMNWGALDPVSEYLGVDDAERWLYLLTVIQGYYERRH